MARRQYSDRDRHARPMGSPGWRDVGRQARFQFFWGKFRRWTGRDSPLRTQRRCRRCRMVNGRRVDGRGRYGGGWRSDGRAPAYDGRPPRSRTAGRRRCGMAEGRRQSKAPDAGQRDTLLPILCTDAVAQPGPVAARQRWRMRPVACAGCDGRRFTRNSIPQSVVLRPFRSYQR